MYSFMLSLLTAVCFVSMGACTRNDSSPTNSEQMLSVTSSFVFADLSSPRVVVCMLNNIGDKPLSFSRFPGFLADWHVSAPITSRQNVITGKMTRVVGAARGFDGVHADEVLTLMPGDTYFDIIHVPESLINQAGYLRCKISFESRSNDPALWSGRVEMQGSIGVRVDWGNEKPAERRELKGGILAQESEPDAVGGTEGEITRD